MIDGEVYRLADGTNAGTLFTRQFGHMRKFRTMADYESLGSPTYSDLPNEICEGLPIGPPMPDASLIEFDDLIEESASHDQLREAFCRHVHGNGIEISAKAWVAAIARRSAPRPYVWLSA